MTRGPGLALIVGLVIGIAAGVGIGALLFNDDDNGGSSGGGSTSTEAIKLPDSLGGFNDIVAVVKAKNPPPATLKAQQDRVESTRNLTEAAYGKAFGGASAAFRQYADAGLEKMPYVIAVRGPAAMLTAGPVTDPKQLGLGASQREVRTVGDVSCQIDRLEVVAPNSTPDPSQENVSLCERTSPKLTVYVGGNGFKGPADMQTMVGLTNAAFTAVGG